MPVPDFVQNQKCWDIEKVIEWKDSHSHINDRGYYDDYYARLREDVKQTPQTPGWKHLSKEEAIWLKHNNATSSSSHHH